MSFNCLSQLTMPNWTVQESIDSNETFYSVASDSIFVDDSAVVTQNDYIGAFYVKFGLEYCAGFTKIDSSAIKIPVKFSTLAQDTLSLKAVDSSFVDSLYFKHWSFQKQCTYEKTLIYEKVKIALIESPSIIEVLSSYSLISPVSYSPTYSNVGQIISPEISNNSSGSFEQLDLSFSSQDVLVDSITGDIDLSLVTENVHQIKIASDICLNQMIYNIEVTNPSPCPGPLCSSTSEPLNLFLASNSSNPQFNQVTIETASDVIEIFDKTGRLIISSPVTFNWNGSDQYGNLVPADDYYIRIGEKVIIITVIQ